MTAHVVNISGGKDSAACYLLALSRGKPFRAVCADTGHEDARTVDWVANLGKVTGGPEVEVVRADFSTQIARKRALVETKWVAEGVAPEIVAAALAVLKPTGIPFLDLCIWKGRFPSRMAQFCTEFLKAVPIESEVFAPIRALEPVVSWQGERSDESAQRRNLPRFQRVKSPGQYDRIIFRPILHWSADNVFSLMRHFALKPNPLYLEGARRVGCLPCINSGKDELAALFTRAPQLVGALRQWELIVGQSSKRGEATFFASNATPQGKALAQAQKRGKRLGESFPTIHDIASWAKTTRGGRQFDGLAIMHQATDGCSSQYGLCE